MISNIEKFDEFIALCESEPEKKTTPIFITEQKTIDENFMLSGEIIVMLQYDQNMFIKYVHNEEIPRYQDIPVKPIDCYSIIKNIDQDIGKKIEEKLVENNHFLDEKLKEEKNKMKKILENIGFKIFINSVWE